MKKKNELSESEATLFDAALRVLGKSSEVKITIRRAVNASIVEDSVTIAKPVERERRHVKDD